MLKEQPRFTHSLEKAASQSGFITKPPSSSLSIKKERCMYLSARQCLLENTSPIRRDNKSGEK
jgi:hypothetical protein